ncbi:MAG: diacylglycerol kinase family protein [Acinetobacter sp.]
MTQHSKPLSIVYNEKSGFHAKHQEDVYEQLMTVFTDHGFEIQVFEFDQQTSIDDVMKQIIERHSSLENKGVVVAAGGDGTLNAVASHLLYSNIPMGILPLGTFNYVARVHQIPLDLLEAALVIATGETKKTHVAKLNDYIYLNNASLGLYPLFIEKREHYNRLLGRLKIHAYTSALDVLLRQHRSLKLEVVVDGSRYPVKTPMVFFGNNSLQLKEMNLQIAQCAREGKLAGVVVAKSDKLTLMKLLVQLLKGEIEHAKEVYQFSAHEVTIHAKNCQSFHAAIDGEIREVHIPLKLSVEKEALTLMVPHVTASV